MEANYPTWKRGFVRFGLDAEHLPYFYGIMCDFIFHCHTPLPVAVPIPPVPNSDDSGSVPQIAEGTSPAEDQEPRSPIHPATPEAAAADTETTHSNVEPTRRYPQRIRKPPDRYSSD